jgi:hypothetical protein
MKSKITCAFAIALFVSGGAMAQCLPVIGCVNRGSFPIVIPIPVPTQRVQPVQPVQPAQPVQTARPGYTPYVPQAEDNPAPRPRPAHVSNPAAATPKSNQGPTQPARRRRPLRQRPRLQTRRPPRAAHRNPRPQGRPLPPSTSAVNTDSRWNTLDGKKPRNDPASQQIAAIGLLARR